MTQLKETYTPPEIQRVKLVRDELAVTVCKTATTASGPVVGCLKGLAGGCKKVGS